MPVQTVTTRADRDNGHERAILEVETVLQLQEEKVAMRKQKQLKKDEHFLQVWLQNTKNFLLNRTFLGILFIVLIGLTIPALIFYLTLDGVQESSLYDTCSVLQGYRVSCGLPNVTNIQYCSRINCCYSNITGGCYHYVPSRYYYEDPRIPPGVWSQDSTIPFNSSLNKTPYWQNSLHNMTISTQEVDKNYFIIILDSEPNLNSVSRVTNNYKYHVNNTQRMYVDAFRVMTDGNLVPIFTTKLGPTIASENYLEWTIDLSADRLFGMGHLQLPDSEITRRVIYPNSEDHNTVATLMAYNATTRQFHGLNIRNTGMLDITILPSKLIFLRSLFTHRLELHLFLGPTPPDIVMQHKSMFSNPDYEVPPYWTLGVHLCRDGLITSVSSALQEHQECLDNALESSIPYDSDCIHENLFTNTFNLTAEEKTRIANAVKTANDYYGKKFVMTLAPHLPIDTNNAVYAEAAKAGILYTQDTQGTVYEGIYRNWTVSYPDFSLEKTGLWLQNEYIPALWNSVEDLALVKGLVLRDNWPVDEGFTLSVANPPKALEPYFDESTNATLNFTLPWYAVTRDPALNSSIRHSSKHARYGSDHAEALRGATSAAKGFLLSASGSQDSNHGIHLQNVNISWGNLRMAVERSLYNSVFGKRPVSVPVCGTTDYFNSETHEHLCTRWYQVATTLPMFRISSDWPRRDPYNLRTQYATDIAVKAIHLRYSLLPYCYTLLQTLEPLVRPLFYAFSDDPETFNNVEQYMLGESILVATPLWPDLAMLKFYLPDPNSVWFEYWGGMDFGKGGRNVSLTVLNTDLVLFLRSGYVLPTRNMKNNETSILTAEESRLENGLDLLVGLNCIQDPTDETVVSCNESRGNLRVEALAEGITESSENRTIVFESTDKELVIKNFRELLNKNCSSGNLTEKATEIQSVYLYGVNKNNWIELKININLCSLDTDPFIYTYNL